MAMIGNGRERYFNKNWKNSVLLLSVIIGSTLDGLIRRAKWFETFVDNALKLDKEFNFNGRGINAGNNSVIRHFLQNHLAHKQI